MSWEQTKVRSFSQTDTLETDHTTNFGKKPIEIYLYIDPLCPKGWEIQPYLRKLAIQYGRYFTIRPLITKHFFTLNQVYRKHIETILQIHKQQIDDFQTKNVDEPILSPWTIALAIKAAELQGKNAGRLFLREIQEAVFLNKNFMARTTVFAQCAKSAHLDIDEFKKDIHSTAAKKALQCDLKLANEMQVEQTPTIVFFNSLNVEQGIKVSGIHPYDIYAHVFLKALKMNPQPEKTPSLLEYIKTNKVVTTDEVSIIYDWSTNKAKNELRKLQLQQIVERKQAQSDNYFWTLIRSS